MKWFYGQKFYFKVLQRKWHRSKYGGLTRSDKCVVDERNKFFCNNFQSTSCLIFYCDGEGHSVVLYECLKIIRTCVILAKVETCSVLWCQYESIKSQRCNERYGDLMIHVFILLHFLLHLSKNLLLWFVPVVGEKDDWKCVAIFIWLVTHSGQGSRRCPPKEK